MNFFKCQKDARRKTRYLLVMMFPVILALALATNFLFALHMPLVQEKPWQNFFTIKSFLLFTVGIGMVVLVSGLVKTIRLARGGGSQVAESLGAELVNPSTGDFYEKRLRNVVEEVALASGAPVPEVYVLRHEQGINAFAAGFLLKDAVIGVTRGAMEQLSRDELEGVVAHEFSHIVHGDMRLNMRLMGIVFGITMLTEFGHMLCRDERYPRNRSSTLGLGLIIIGYSGTFFANIIRSWVNRSREYLADAAAVQYTRNNEAIATALSKIGGSTMGSRLRAASASEVSHMMFGSSIDSFLDGMFATHPPLEKRISKLMPDWDGEFIVPSPVGQEKSAQEQKLSPIAVSAGVSLAAASLSGSLRAMGCPNASHHDYARSLIRNLPIRVACAIHDKDEALHIIMALLLDENPGVLKKQAAIIDRHFSQDVTRSTMELQQDLEVSRLLSDRLAILEMALPALRHCSPEQQKSLQKVLEELAGADGRVSVREWSLMTIVDHQLEDRRQSKDNLGSGKYRHLRSVRNEVVLLVKTLVTMSGMSKADKQACFRQAMKTLGLVPGKSSQKVNFKALNQALKKVTLLYPEAKEKLLGTLCDCIQHDGKVVLEEAQALRAIAVTLECPVPPLVDLA
ncbi:MAG: M48 family metallopeptidase [Endozoicomonas sp.]